MKVDLRQMRQILALAEHGSFARAAVTLRMSQPALSRSVQSVEREIGTTLFQRSTTGAEPTDIGRLFIHRARQILELSADLDRDILGDPSLQSGLVAVGGGPYPVQSLLGIALARFVGAQPRIAVRVTMRDWDELSRRLRSRDLDLFVAEVSTLLGENDLEIEVMEAHPLFFAARRDHPLVGRSELGAVDLFGFPVLSASRVSPRILEPMRAAQRRSVDPTAATRLFPAVECNALATLVQVTRATDAIMGSTLSCIEAELESGDLVLLGTEPWLHLRYGIVQLKCHPLSQAAARFREYIIEAEKTISMDEARLLARWAPGTSSR